MLYKISLLIDFVFCNNSAFFQQGFIWKDNSNLLNLRERI